MGGWPGLSRLIKRAMISTAAASLSACVETAETAKPPASMTIDGLELTVAYEDDIYNATPKIIDGAEIEVFPLVSGMVVRRSDNGDLTALDKGKALKAAEAYCGKSGQHPQQGVMAKSKGQPPVALLLFGDCMP